MTGIREFLRKINDRPSCMRRVKWQEETDNFRYRRLRAIIMGIEDAEVCQLARDYIINTWCYTKKESPEEIVRRLDDCFVERNAKVLERLHKQELDNKAQQLEQKPMPCENACRSEECQRLQEENDRHAINQARLEGIRSVVEQLIVYGEKFPSNQNDRAEIIKEALLAKSFNGHIPSDALTSEWRTRLMNLGRKEMGVSFQGESMFKISGNDQVNIGGHSNGK